MRKLVTCFLLLMVICLKFGYSQKSELSHDEKPNVLFIYTDDQSHRTISSYLNEGAWPWVQTPNIDRLAAEGVRFTSAYGASWCTPSKASVLTGQLPHNIKGMRVHEQRDENRKWACMGDCYDMNEVEFWPKNLREFGYTTSMIGKWHLGQNPGHGDLWDHSIVWDQNTPDGDWYNNQKLSFNGNPEVEVPGYSTDVYTRFAEDFIRENDDKPWFLWLCYNAPHLPNTTHPRHDSLYNNVEIDIPKDIFGPRPDKPLYMRDLTFFEKADKDSIKYRNKPLAEVVAEYNRLVRAIDDGVGDLLKVLEETGQMDNTIVVFTSDQGFAWGEHGFAWKVAPYDACMRMPLIFKYPKKIAQGGISTQPVTIVDVATTIIEYTGLELPWKLDGYDLRPLLSNPKLESNLPIMMEHFNSKFGEETNVGETGSDYTLDVPYWIFLRQGDYKYIRTLVPNEVEELYDLANDPDELRNLASISSYKDKMVEMRDLMMKELIRTNAGYIDSMPPIAKSE